MSNVLSLPDLPDRDPDVVVGETIHLLMRRRRMTQREMADVLGIAQASLSRKVLGKRPWTLAELQRAASVLDTDVAALVAGLPRLDSNQQPSGYLSAQVSGHVIDLDAVRLERVA